jgi:transcription elongation factor
MYSLQTLHINMSYVLSSNYSYKHALGILFKSPQVVALVFSNRNEVDKTALKPLINTLSSNITSQPSCIGCFILPFPKIAYGFVI